MPLFRVSALNYLSWAEHATSTEALAAFRGADVTLTDHGDPERLLGSAITASMFSVLGLPPLVGRPLRAEDERPGSHRVALLAEPLWRRRFGGDPAIVGRSITLNGERHQVIGVVPQAFREVGRTRISSAGSPQVFVPLTIDPARENRGNHVIRVVGRLRRGFSVDQTREEMRRIAAALEREFPATNRGWGVRVEMLSDSMLDERIRPSLLVLFGAVGMVLLIACANVVNLLLAKGVSRQRELALRTALGAGRSRLIRQLVTESVCLAVVSGACGLVVAVFAVQTVRTVLPPTLPRIDEVRLDATVLGFGVLISLAIGLFIGMVPAIRASRGDLVSSLGLGGKGLAGPSRGLLRHAIVVAQMALATMLLVGAALLLQSFLRLRHVDPGFEPDGVITARISLPRAKYPDQARTSDFYRRLLESLKEVPQVQAAGLGTSAPFAPGVRAGGSARDSAYASTSPDASVSAVEHIVSPNYFQTLGIPLLAGRSFGQGDDRGAPLVAIVSESVARQLWAGRNPVGQRIDWNGARRHEVIGVVGDIRGSDGTARGGGLDRQPSAAAYFSATQLPQHAMTLVVRTSGEPSAIVTTIVRAVHDIDPAQPVYQIRSVRDWLDESAAQPRLTTALTGVFALAAVLLATVGIYGVLSYSVVQRRQEIGLRMAIGAERGQIMRLVLRGGMGWALTGVAIGLLSAIALSQVLKGLLFEIQESDPTTYSVVTVMLTVVATLACSVPAARATRIDPMIVLRAE